LLPEGGIRCAIPPYAGYIHHNPVKHGHADRVVGWPYSSFHRYVERGVYPPDWAAAPAVRGLSVK